jgi:hypothetical protein
MAHYAFSQPDGAAITVEEAIGLLPEAMKYRGRERCLHLADLAGRMSGEIEYLQNYIIGLFETGGHFNISDGYRDTSLLLGRTPDFALRVNKWKPLHAKDAFTLAEFGLSYDVPHNHDFQLITKGIWGDGYETDIYRFDAEHSFGACGEQVDLPYLGRFKLARGAVIWFEQFHDVHIQRPPATFSMSFNIIPIEAAVKQGQFFFDVDRCAIDGFPRSRHARILSLLGLLTDFGRTPEALEVVTDIGLNTRNDWLKLAIGCLLSDRWQMEREEAFERIKLGRPPESLASLPNSSFSPGHIR